MLSNLPRKSLISNSSSHKLHIFIYSTYRQQGLPIHVSVPLHVFRPPLVSSMRWRRQHASRSVGHGGGLNPMGKPSSSFLTTRGDAAGSGVPDPRGSAAQNRLDVAEATGHHLVGRKAGVTLLRERWAQSTERLGQVVLLSGEAGIGKSRWCVCSPSVSRTRACHG